MLVLSGQFSLFLQTHLKIKEVVSQTIEREITAANNFGLYYINEGLFDFLAQGLRLQDVGVGPAAGSALAMDGNPVGVPVPLISLLYRERKCQE